VGTTDTTYVLTSEAFCGLESLQFSLNFPTVPTFSFTAATKTVTLFTPETEWPAGTYTATSQVVSCRWGHHHLATRRHIQTSQQCSSACAASMMAEEP
jgi:hypothetical protein